MYDIVLKNGYIVYPKNTIKANIYIKDKKISLISSEKDQLKAKKIIDVTNKFVMPGIIEPHMHVELPIQGCVSANNFYTQSISAAFGGVTMFMDFINIKSGESIIENIKLRKEEMAKSAIDYGIHSQLVECNNHILKEMEYLNYYGCPSFKIYMTYKDRGLMLDDKSILMIVDNAKNLNLLPMVHAESDSIFEFNLSKLEKTKNFLWSTFPNSKPNLCEVEAVNRIVNFSKYIGNALLIVHVSARESLQIIKNAQDNGLPIYTETCPQYLTLTKKIYKNPNGFLAICSPPLRSSRDLYALWNGIKQDVITTIGSDDCAYTIKEKTVFLVKDKNGNYKQDFRKIVNGLPGIETRLPLLLSEGVNKNKISINKLCEICCTNIAKLYGCYPQKGIIAPGSDADIVVIDMEKEVILSQNILHNNVDYCLYEGLKVKGFPIITISKGKIIVENEIFYGNVGDGEFIKRELDPKILDTFNF
jgi:dihydropyrimidinase